MMPISLSILLPFHFGRVIKIHRDILVVARTRRARGEVSDDDEGDDDDAANRVGAGAAA